MGNPILIVSICMGKSIRIKKLNDNMDLNNVDPDHLAHTSEANF